MGDSYRSEGAVLPCLSQDRVRTDDATSSELGMMGPGLEFSESGTATGGVHKIPIKETVVAASSSDSSLSEGE